MASQSRPRYEYEWHVDPLITDRATRFVDEFNDLMGERLPRPGPSAAEMYWESNERALIGRCVALGKSPFTASYYHWAVKADESGQLVVDEFWSDELWTTKRYSELIHSGSAAPVH